MDEYHRAISRVNQSGHYEWQNMHSLENKIQAGTVMSIKA